MKFTLTSNNCRPFSINTDSSMALYDLLSELLVHSQDDYTVSFKAHKKTHSISIGHKQLINNAYYSELFWTDDITSNNMTDFLHILSEMIISKKYDYCF